jgi:hypothetical protein
MEIPNNSIQYYNKRQKRQTPQTQTICIYSFFQLSHIPSSEGSLTLTLFVYIYLKALICE